ncbi:placenta growth factor isoform X2 [Tachyglossus aculeatus]|uniref:placenta growth factor isoform X2 n=1 Tax=Tachyglossus aculeatus TaxID=9261 RepID=UPI0018F35A56|nr:placenta growth factor isoform X2 [Tachyglossus aculeatus]
MRLLTCFLQLLAGLALPTPPPQWDQLSGNSSTSEGEVLPFQEVWGRSFCRALEKLVEIVAEYPGEVEHVFSPSCVSLRRCTGCCGDESLQCVPVETANVTMQLLKIKSEEQTSYMELTFTEHVRCECRRRTKDRGKRKRPRPTACHLTPAGLVGGGNPSPDARPGPEAEAQTSRAHPGTPPGLRESSPPQAGPQSGIRKRRLHRAQLGMRPDICGARGRPQRFPRLRQPRPSRFIVVIAVSAKRFRTKRWIRRHPVAAHPGAFHLIGFIQGLLGAERRIKHLGEFKITLNKTHSHCSLAGARLPWGTAQQSDNSASNLSTACRKEALFLRNHLRNGKRSGPRSPWHGRNHPAQVENPLRGPKPVAFPRLGFGSFERGTLCPVNSL